MVQHTEKDEEKGQGHLNVGPFSTLTRVCGAYVGHVSVPLLLLLITIIGTNVEPT